MKKQALLMVVFLAAVGLLAGVTASNAFAYAGGFTMVCGPCHGAAGAAPTVSLVENDGTTATYNVSDATAFEWAVFNGATRITGTGEDGNTATAGSFMVPVGSTYTIYAAYGVADGGVSGGQTTVSPQGLTTYTITPTAGANGSISPDTAQTVASGGSVTFTMTPADGYKVADVLVNGSSVGAVTTYEFTEVAADATISASFEPAAGTTYTITPTVGANGTITPATAQIVAKGDQITFAIVPGAGFYIDTLTVDGAAVQPAKSYTFTNVTADHTIAATFAATPAMCSITSSMVSSGGTIVPGAPVWMLPVGGGITYYFVPDAGYHVDTVLVDGWPVALDDDAYSFEKVDRDHTVSVEFAANVWTLSASISGKGSIDPTGTQEVLEGTSATYAITPDAGNKISDVLVDGVSIGIQTSYTFDSVTEDHTIQAKFVTDAVTHTITPSVVNGVGGTISPHVPYTIASGAGVIFYFVPSIGYEVGSVTVDGELVDPSAWVDEDSYVFALVSADHTIAVTFVPVITYDITPSAGDHGSITPTTVQTLNEGDSATFTITPDAGYHVADVLVDGVSVGAVTSFEFIDVTANHTISASYAWTKLSSTAALKRSARVVKRNGYVWLTVTLKGAAGVNNTGVRIEVKKPGKRSYRLLKTVKVKSNGVATYKYKLRTKGKWYFRAKFTGNATYLPAPLRSGLKVTVR